MKVGTIVKLVVAVLVLILGIVVIYTLDNNFKMRQEAEAHALEEVDRVLNGSTREMAERNRLLRSQGTLTETAQSAAPSVKKGSFTDSRDGKVYKTVKIGDSQTWMAENLNYAANGSVCYENKEANCAKYGRLYDWAAATGACPAGWRLPEDREWATLVNYVGGESIAGKKLKSTSGWTGGGNGTDDFEFSALPGGGLSDGKFDGVGNYGVWWSATEGDANCVWRRYMRYNNEYVGWNALKKSYQFSVRCVQEANNTGSAPSEKIDSRLVGKWCDAGDADGCLNFRANGTFSRTDYDYENDDGTEYETTGRWNTVGNKITMTFSNGNTTVQTYSINNTNPRGLTGIIMLTFDRKWEYGKVEMK